MSTDDPPHEQGERWQSPPAPPAQPPPPPPPPPSDAYGAAPPPPPGQGAPAYGNPNAPYGGGYGYNPYMPPQTEGTAIGALVAAIASWVACPIIPAIVGLVLASTARRKIAESGGRLTGDGLVTAAKWISWINIGLWTAGIVFFGLIAGIALVSEPSRPGGPIYDQFRRAVLALG